MVLITVILIALALSADAFAVSVTSGAILRDFKVRHAFRLAGFFGGFQAIMPLLGYFAGTQLKDYISGFDHWIAFGLLVIIGGKMLVESFQLDGKKEGGFDPTRLAVVFTLAVATSIDALAIGITLSLLAMPIMASASIIGVITFGLSLLGVYIGVKMGHFFENRIETVAGVVLILIGIKILISG